MNPARPRYAIYFAPQSDHPLAQFGCGVLGRDALSDRSAPIHPQLISLFPDWLDRVAAAAHYGFHATLKPPFELAPGINEQNLRVELAALCAKTSPVPLGALKVAAVNGFAACVPRAACPAVDELAANLVRSLDHLRAPLTDADRTRRRPERLSERQRRYLDRWGYPYVMDEFQFHMTLTDRLQAKELAVSLDVLARLFAGCTEEIKINDVCVFRQTDRTSPFALLDRKHLTG